MNEPSMLKPFKSHKVGCSNIIENQANLFPFQILKLDGKTTKDSQITVFSFYYHY